MNTESPEHLGDLTGAQKSLKDAHRLLEDGRDLRREISRRLELIARIPDKDLRTRIRGLVSTDFGRPGVRDALVRLRALASETAAVRERQKLDEYRRVGLGEKVVRWCPVHQDERGVWPVTLPLAVTCERLLEWNDGEHRVA